MSKKYKAEKRAGQWVVVDADHFPFICSVPTYYKNAEVIAKHIAKSLTLNTKQQLEPLI